MALLFRWTDRTIGKSEWYLADRGYKSQTVTYTLAWLAAKVADRGKASLDWSQVWNFQDVPEELQNLITALAPQVAVAIKAAPDHVKNVSEYCKFEECWQRIAKTEFSVPALPEHLTLAADEIRMEKKTARSTAKIDSEIDLDVLLLTLTSKAEIVRRTAERRGLLSPKSNAALLKLGSGNMSLVRSEKNAMKLLIERLAEEGAPVQEL